MDQTAASTVADLIIGDSLDAQNRWEPPRVPNRVPTTQEIGHEKNADLGESPGQRW
jgi:hypothetical protein